MRPGYFVVSVYSPAVQPRAQFAGRWVMGLRWEGLTAAVHRQRQSSFSGSVARAPDPPHPRQMIRGQLSAADYRRIADQRMSDGRVDVHLAVDERGVPTACRVSHSSGNPAVDERTCALLLDQARFELRVDSSGTAVADSFTLQIYVDEVLPNRPPFAQPIEVGQTVSGRLESGDRVAGNGAFYDAYTVTAPRATGIRITMQSAQPAQSAELFPALRAAIDKPPYRLGGRWSGTRGSPDLKAWVDVPAGARARIEARALMRGMQGAYTLQVTAIQPDSPSGGTGQR
jgi:TonB family protein